jgi:hypothetical protein
VTEEYRTAPRRGVDGPFDNAAEVLDVLFEGAGPERSRSLVPTPVVGDDVEIVEATAQPSE